MLNLPIYGNKKLRLAFEYGMVLAKTAIEMKHEITPELMKKAEIMLENEFRNRDAEDLAIDMAPNIMSAFELDISK